MTSVEEEEEDDSNNEERRRKHPLSFVIENLTSGDIDATDVVLRRAFNTEHSYRPQLELYLDVQPGGCFIAKQNGTVVGSGGCMDYGQFAYVGLMATDPIFQHQGIGRKVLEKILNWLDARKCPTVLLDARPAAVPLYEHLGFADEDSTFVFERRGDGESRNRMRNKNDHDNNHPHAASISHLLKVEMPQLESFDFPIFGAQRGLLIRSYWENYPERFIVSHDSAGRIDGYLVAQLRTIGPWIAINCNVAEGLLSRALEEFSFKEGDESIVCLSGSNIEARRLLEKFGFKWQRSLRHMYRGKRVQRARATKIYGQASLGFG